MGAVVSVLAAIGAAIGSALAAAGSFISGAALALGLTELVWTPVFSGTVYYWVGLGAGTGLASAGAAAGGVAIAPPLLTLVTVLTEFGVTVASYASIATAVLVAASIATGISLNQSSAANRPLSSLVPSTLSYIYSDACNLSEKLNGGLQSSGMRCVRSGRVRIQGGQTRNGALQSNVKTSVLSRRRQLLLHSKSPTAKRRKVDGPKRSVRKTRRRK